MKQFIAMLCAALTLVSCSNKKADQTTSSSKTLILYYSQTGATQSVATELKNQLNADIEAISIEKPYDGDFSATIARCQQEMAEGTLPTLLPLKADIAKYDTIYLGYPVWFGTYAPPIQSLLKQQSFEGKVVIPFCTFGSGGLLATVKALHEALPSAQVATDGYGVRNARIAKASTEINRFLIERGYKAGEVEALPAFMEHLPVTEADVEVFDDACGDYQFPLGIPMDVAIRETEACIDYEFTALNRDQEGNEVYSTIYVTVEKKEGAKPEFTQVVR